MDWFHRLWARLRAHSRGAAAEREVRDEFEFHVALEAEKLVQAGVPAADARRRALVAFGGVDRHREQMRAGRSFPWLEDAMNDVRYALRWLRRAPGFTAVVILTLGLGIGAATAIFTVVNVVLLRPLPYPDGDALAVIYAQHQPRGWRNVNISHPDYLSWKEDVSAFERLGIFQWTSKTITGDGVQAERVAAADVDADLFRVLGVEPLLGRGIGEADEADGSDFVAVIGYGLWQRRYGGDESVLGRDIVLNGRPHAIIGVMPPRFEFPYAGQVWRPLVTTGEDYRGRGNRFLAGAIGRLRDGVTHEQAVAELAQVSKLLERAHSDTNTGWEAQYVPLREDLFGELRTAMLIALGAAGLVLLVVCGNVANLLLARSAARAREMALRASLGARGGRLVRQVITETAVLAGIGGAFGMLVARGGVIALCGFFADRIPAFIEITPDLRVYGFALAITTLVALLAGVLPARRGTNVDTLAIVKEGGRATTGPHGSRLRGALIVAEVAFTVVLLAGAALLIRTMHALTNIEAGFRVENILTARYSLPASKYDTDERSALFQSELIERLRAQAGVLQVGAVQGTPYSGWNVGTSYEVEGEPPAQPGQAPSVHFQAVTPEFFDVLGIPLLRGRMIETLDRADAQRVGVVNEAFVARHFRDVDPIGRRLRLCCGDGPWISIIGVVGDYRHFSLTEPMSPAIYLPYAQEVRTQMTVAIQTAGPPADMIPTLRHVLAEIDPDVPAFRVETLAEDMARQTWVQRIARDILAAFALSAALLAVIGLWGVISYSVARQRHELGIRLALGAEPRRLLAMVMRQGLMLALLGIAIGWTIAFLASGALERLLFEVQPADPITFLVVPLFVAALAAVATLIPAGRAARTDPMVALRNE